MVAKGAKETKGAGTPKVRPFTRADLVELEDSGETLESIRAALATAPPVAPSMFKGIRKLFRKDIVIATGVFQWRDMTRDRVAHEDHAFEMAKLLRDKGSEPLDPILVFPVGVRFYVVDGHHRMWAYDSANWSKQIPVVVFSGSLEDAQDEAVMANSKSKLPMDNRNKQENAWRYVKLGTKSKAEIKTITQVSNGNLGRMRKYLEVLKQAPDLEAEDIAGMSWEKTLARDRLKKSGKYDSDKERAKAVAKLYRTLEKHSLTRTLKNSKIEVLATVLNMIDSNLAKGLMCEWFNEHREYLEELREERRADEEREDVKF